MVNVDLLAKVPVQGGCCHSGPVSILGQQQGPDGLCHSLPPPFLIRWLDELALVHTVLKVHLLSALRLNIRLWQAQKPTC